MDCEGGLLKNSEIDRNGFELFSEVDDGYG